MIKISEGEFEAWNDEMIKKYNPSILNHPNAIVRFIERKRLNVLLKLLSPKKNDVILEIGCGYGEILDKIHINQLYGVDISDLAVSKSEELLKGRAVIQKANAEKLPFPDHFFTKVYCSEVLEHLFHPDRALEEASRVLKEDGYIVITIPNEPLIDNFKTILVKLKLFSMVLKGRSVRMTDEWHLHSFDLDYLSKCMPSFLEIEQVNPVPFKILPLRYVVKLRPRFVSRKI